MRSRSLSLSRHVTRVLLLCGLLTLSACQKPPAANEPVRAVKVLTVGQALAESEAAFSGEIRAKVESTLAFRVAGKVVSRPAEVGQRVKAAQVLAQLDSQDYQAAAQAAQAQVLAAQSNRVSLEADYRRYQGLFEQGFISAAELQRREAAMKAAQAQWQQAQAQLTVQGNQANYTRLLADGDGVVTAIDVQPGQVVAAGQPVVRVALDGPREVVFSIAENQLPSLKAGDTVVVEPWGRSERLQARVRDVAQSADPVTRSFLVKAVLPKEAQAWVLGSTATVRRTPSASAPASPAPASPAFVLPGTALRVEGGQTAVWVLDPTTMTVRSQAVQVKTAQGNEALIESGLHVGDEVVVTGVHVLSPGQKVTRFQPK